MCIICQKCGSIAEYNKSYGRITCTRCSWKSEPLTIQAASQYTYFQGDRKIEQEKKKIKN